MVRIKSECCNADVVCIKNSCSGPSTIMNPPFCSNCQEWIKSPTESKVLLQGNFTGETRTEEDMDRHPDDR